MSKEPLCYYRLSRNTDPEERLEDAALWKALHDEYGDQIELLDDETSIPENSIFFGRTRRFRGEETCSSSGNIGVDYWNDEAFLSYSGRRFELCDWEKAHEVVAEIHATGKGAFVKAIDHKLMTRHVPVGASLADLLGDMVYSFLDRPNCLMVQEYCRFEYEQRFLFIGRELVAKSPIAWHLTPLDTHNLPANAQFKTPKDAAPEIRPDADLEWLAKKVAGVCKFSNINIDCAFIDGRPGVVEFNDLHLGQIGLYACDVRSLARASRRMVVSRKVELRKGKAA